MPAGRRDILILAGLFAALIAFVALGPARQQPAGPDRPTTHASGPGGALALYEWARAMGYDAQRLEYRAFELADEDSALVILSPARPVTRAEARAALAWVERGGTLLLADDSSGFGPRNALLDELKVDVAVLTGTETIALGRPLQPALSSPPVAEPEVAAERYLAPARPDVAPLLGGQGAGDPLLVGGIRHGAGYVFVSATARPFTNQGLRDPQSAALVLNMLRRVPPGGRVLFDELHHGFVTPPGAAGGLLSSPWGWAGLYAAASVALYLALSGRRFGRAVPLLEEAARRSSAEYVESMADLFQRAGKRAYVRQHYRAALKRRLARPYGVSPQLDDEEFVRELARARELDEPALLALLARLRAEGGEAELLGAVAAADAFAADAARPTAPAGGGR